MIKSQAEAVLNLETKITELKTEMEGKQASQNEEIEEKLTELQDTVKI